MNFLPWHLKIEFLEISPAVPNFQFLWGNKLEQS